MTSSKNIPEAASVIKENAVASLSASHGVV